MTAQYLKLSRQIARQQPELDAYLAQIAAAQPAIDAAQAALDAATATAAASQAALAALQSDANMRQATLANSQQMYADAVTRAESAPDAEALATALSDQNTAAALMAAAESELTSLAPLIEAAQATATADATTASTAQSALQALTGPRDVLQGHADAIAASIAACQAALVDTGETPTQAEVDAYSLTQDRATVWARIKWHRDMCKAEGVQVGTKWYHSDADSRIQQLGLVMMGANVPAVAWKTMDGSFVTMTPTLAGQIFQATAARDMAVFAAAEQHRAAVNASTDPLAYHFTATGWPAGYVG